MVAPNFESMGFVGCIGRVLDWIAHSIGLPAHLADTDPHPIGPAHLADTDPHPIGPVTINGIVIGQTTSTEWGASLDWSELDPTVGPLGDHRQNYRDN